MLRNRFAVASWFDTRPLFTRLFPVPALQCNDALSPPHAADRLGAGASSQVVNDQMDDQSCKPAITHMRSKSLAGQYRFSLAGLLLFVTAICGFLAFHCEWIRQRNAIRRDPRVSRNYYLAVNPDAPLTLRLFGETGEYVIYVDQPKPGEVERVKMAFPEALVESEEILRARRER